MIDWVTMTIFFVVLAVALLLVAFWAFTRDHELTAFLLAGLGVFSVLAAGMSFTSFYNERTIECTVTEKDRGVDSEGSSEYRVYTEDCGTFVNEDDVFHGKFDSGDVQGQIKVGERYELHVVGPRFGPFSLFPNILDVKPVD